MVLLIIAIFNHPAVQTASAEMLHEIKTADVWQTTAYTPVANVPPIDVMNQQGAWAQQAAMTQQGSAYPYPNGVQGTYPQYQVQTYTPQDPNQPVALANPLPVDPDKPVLIKQIGAEVRLV